MKAGDLVKIREDLEIRSMMIDLQDPRGPVSIEGYERMFPNQLAIILDVFQDITYPEMMWAKILTSKFLGFLSLESLEKIC